MARAFGERMLSPSPFTPVSDVDASVSSKVVNMSLTYTSTSGSVSAGSRFVAVDWKAIVKS